MRLMSFMLTTAQVRARTKTVTRRIGWEFAAVGDQLRAVEKAQGLRRGEKIKVIGIIEITAMRREPLSALVDDLRYGEAEMTAEGFPDKDPQWFVDFFARSHKCLPGATVTRIAFKYVD